MLKIINREKEVVGLCTRHTVSFHYITLGGAISLPTRKNRIPCNLGSTFPHISLTSRRTYALHIWWVSFTAPCVTLPATVPEETSYTRFLRMFIYINEGYGDVSSKRWFLSGGHFKKPTPSFTILMRLDFSQKLQKRFRSRRPELSTCPTFTDFNTDNI